MQMEGEQTSIFASSNKEHVNKYKFLEAYFFITI
jgi:hypothetical protein